MESDDGPKIQKANISEVLRLGEQALTHKADTLSQNIAPFLKKILDATGSFAICVKNCFIEKNHNGFCYDRYK